MRRGRRGRPHLLCPPCPPIGPSGGPGAEPSVGAGSPAGAEPSAGAEPARSSKSGRYRRGRWGHRSNSSWLPRARRSHGRSAPAFRAVSGTEELGHRCSRSSRSQDRGGEALSGRGSPHSAKPVSSIRLRGVSAVQCHRICIPRVCFSQSYRERKQGRRHCVADLLGGVRPVRSGRVLQRSTPVLVPFLLRGQVRLPVILHDSGALERGVNSVSSRRAAALSKTSRSLRQRRDPSQQKGSGRGSWDSQGRQGKPESSGEAQIRTPPSLCPDPQPTEKGPEADPQDSDSSSDSEPEPELRRSSSQAKPSEAGSPAPQPTLGQFPSPTSPGSTSISRGHVATGSASGSQIPNKVNRGPHRNRGSMSSRTAHRTRGLGPSGQSQRSTGPSPPAGKYSGTLRTGGQTSVSNQQSPLTSPGQATGRGTQTGQATGRGTPPGQASGRGTSPAQGTGRDTTPVPGSTNAAQSTHRSSGSNHNLPRAQSPSRAPEATYPGSRTPGEPGDVAPKSTKQTQKTQTTQGSGGCSVPERIVPCRSESSLEYMSESTTEITCNWPRYSHRLSCPHHCWLLQHLAY